MARATLILDDELFARAFNRPPYAKTVQSPQPLSQPLPNTKSAQLSKQPNEPASQSTPLQRPPSPIPAATQNVPHFFPLNTNRWPTGNHTGNDARRSSGAASQEKTLKNRLTRDYRRTNMWPAVRWTAAGFIVGIAFWHIVGFWDFVSKVVLDDGHTAIAAQGERSRPAQLRRPAAASQASASARDASVRRQRSIEIVTGSIGPVRTTARGAPIKRKSPTMSAVARCINLVRVPGSSTAISMPCRANVPDLVASGGSTLVGRVDRVGRVERAARVAPVNRQRDGTGPLWSTVIKKSARP